MIFYSVVLFLGILSATRYAKSLQLTNLNNWHMPIAFALKVFSGMFFLYVYTYLYGNGNLSADAGDFMLESKIINGVFYESPIAYFKFLTGIGDTKKLQMAYIESIGHWDIGAQAIINDTKNILRFHSLIHFISFNNPIIHIFVMSLLSLFAVKNFLTGLIGRTTISVNVQFWMLVCIPSVLFWTSGLLKEPILFLGLSLLFRGAFAEERRARRIITSSIGVLLLIGIKPYVLISMLPAIIFYIAFKYLKKYKLFGAILIVIILASSILVLFPKKVDTAVHLITRKQQDFKNIAKGGIYALNGAEGFYYFEPRQIKDVVINDKTVTIKKSIDVYLVDVGGIKSPVPVRLSDTSMEYPIYFMRNKSNGYINIPQINDSFVQLLKNIPTALCNSLFRPYFNDPGGWLKYPASIEVYLVFMFLLLAIIRHRKIETIDWGLILSLLLFVLTLSLTIGLVTPVLGAISRYRIPAYIALVFVGMLIYEHKKMTHE